MADLTEQQSAQSVKVTGASLTGIEDNYLDVDSSGRITVNQGAAGAANWLTNIAAFGGSAVALGQAVMASSIPVVLASNQSSIPVTQSGTWTTARSWTLSSGGDSVSAVQSGSWSVTANIGSTNGLALDATLTGGTQRTKITDGTNNAAVKAASTAAAATDPALVVAVSPNNTVAVTQSGSWTVQQGGAPWSVSQSGSPWGVNLTQVGGSALALGQTTMASSIPVVIASNQSALTVAQATAANLNATIVFASPQAVTQSGTWTVQPGNTANTTPWLVTVSTALPTGSNTIGAVTQASGPWTQNITQFGGNNVVTGTGASGSGIPRVTVANDSNILATQSGTWTTARSWTLNGSGLTPDSVLVNQNTAAALSGAWPVKVTDGTNTLPTLDTASRAGFLKITDGTNTAAVKAASTSASATDPALVVTVSPNSTNSTNLTQIGSNTVQTGGVNGSLGVGGLASAGSAVAGKPVLVGGTDGTNARAILTDTAGRIIIAGVDNTAKSIGVVYSGSQAIAGGQAGMFFNGIRYTVPASYKFVIGTFTAHSNNTRATVRAAIYKQLGTYNLGTNVFTDGASYTSPQFATEIEAEVTTALNATADTTVTVTYTNQSGTTGQTATALIPKSTPAGYKVLFTLAAGDFGVTDITAVSDNTSTTGVISINGLVLLYQQDINQAGFDLQFSQSFGGAVVNAGEILALDALASAASSDERTIRAIGVLEAA